MEENTNNVVENTGYDVTTNSNDSMAVMLVRTIVIVLIGGLIVKLVKRVVNWFKESKRLRKAEAERKREEELEKLAEKRAQQKLDELLADSVKEKESEMKESPVKRINNLFILFYFFLNERKNQNGRIQQPGK